MAKDAEVDPATEQAPVTIQRQADGRHAVISAGGAVLGMHNSPFSAARQVHNYFGPVANANTPGTPQPAKAAPPTKLAHKFKHDKVIPAKIPHV